MDTKMKRFVSFNFSDSHSKQSSFTSLFHWKYVIDAFFQFIIKDKIKLKLISVPTALLSQFV